MANGSVTDTGLKELRAAIEQLPDSVTTALKGVAHDTAFRIHARASATARSIAYGEEPRLGHTKGQPHMADSIEVIEQAEQKQYVVDVNTPWLPMLGTWIERGTSKMRARPFLRPAGDAEDARYKADSVKAADQAVTVALKVGD